MNPSLNLETKPQSKWAKVRICFRGNLDKTLICWDSLPSFLFWKSCWKDSRGPWVTHPLLHSKAEQQDKQQPLNCDIEGRGTSSNPQGDAPGRKKPTKAGTTVNTTFFPSPSPSFAELDPVTSSQLLSVIRILRCSTDAPGPLDISAHHHVGRFLRVRY